MPKSQPISKQKRPFKRKVHVHVGILKALVKIYIVPERKNLFSKKPAHYQEIFF
jgi:hypothetical protein